MDQDELAALRQQALRSIARSSKKVQLKSKHKDHHNNQIEADFGIDELLVDESSNKQIGSKQQQLGLEQRSHLSDTSAALKELRTEPKLEYGHGEQRTRRPTEKESVNNHSLSRSVSTYSSSSRSHSYSSNGSNSPSGSVSSGSSYTPTHSSSSSKSNHSTHPEMLKNDTHDKYLCHSEPLKKSATQERKLVDTFPSSPHHAQSDRRSFSQNGSRVGRSSREVGDHQYEERREQPSRLLERRRDPLREPLRPQPNDKRRREPLRLQPYDERRREPLRLQSSDERRREPLRLRPNEERRESLRIQSNDERRREPLRLQSSDERRREPLRLQSSDERRREPLRLQPNDERRRETLRMQSNVERKREVRSRDEPLRLQSRDERRREPLGLQSNSDRRREPVRLRSNDDRRRETLRLQPREERRRDAKSREEPSRLQSDAIRRVRRSPVRTGAGVGYGWRIEHSRDENSDSKRDDTRQSFGHSRSNRSSMHLASTHLASTERHVGAPSLQAHNNAEIEQNAHKKRSSSPQRPSYQRQGEREIATHELKSRKRRASPDKQPIDFLQKRVHVDERRENVYSSKESKERKRGSSSDDGRRHLQATGATVHHHDVTKTPEQVPSELNHRKESQDHAREYSEPVKFESELWSEPARDHPMTDRADLLGLSDTQGKEAEEELDYDENMEDIDVHVYRPEDLDIQEKDKEEKNTEQSISSAPEPPAVLVLPDEPEMLSEVLIRSPIRVSPERKRFKAKDSERLPVKERLYLSKSAIQRKKEERLVHYREDPKPRLRPSLASRLGPAPHRRGSKHKESSIGPSGKGSATATTVDEYRKKKQEVDVRQEDIERARRIAKSLNEHETKAATRTNATEDKNTQPQEKEKSLDEVIDKIKEKNKSIVRRKKEIEMDVEQYGQ